MDSTNQGIGQAGTAPAGTMARRYAMKRLEQVQQRQGVQRPGRIQPPQTITIGKRRT